jgi:hypothetical protein
VDTGATTSLAHDTAPAALLLLFALRAGAADLSPRRRLSLREDGRVARRHVSASRHGQSGLANQAGCGEAFCLCCLARNRMQQMVEELIDGSGRLLAGLLRGVWWFIAEIIFEWFLGAVGWTCGRLLTLGRWPACAVGEVDQLSGFEYFAVLALGFLSVAGIGFVLLKYIF